MPVWNPSDKWLNILSIHGSVMDQTVITLCVWKRVKIYGLVSYNVIMMGDFTAVLSVQANR